jgi:hypothetical protein
MPIDLSVPRMKSEDSPPSKCMSSDLAKADDRFEHGKSVEYSGSRSLDKLKAFALKSVKP